MTREVLGEAGLFIFKTERPTSNAKRRTLKCFVSTVFDGWKICDANKSCGYIRIYCSIYLYDFDVKRSAFDVGRSSLHNSASPFNTLFSGFYAGNKDTNQLVALVKKIISAVKWRRRSSIKIFEYRTLNLELFCFDRFSWLEILRLSLIHI